MIKEIYYIFLKDLKLDLRSKQNFISMLFFSIIILLVFAFALPAEEQKRELLTPGIYWVTFLLSGILSLNKSFQIEKENSCIDALLLAPVSRGSIFLGKMFSNVVFVMTIQLILIPLVGLLFHHGLIVYFLELIFLSFITCLGFSSLGTLLSGLTTDLQFKEILLPILLFPLLVPILLASVNIMQSILAGTGLLGESDWVKLLIAFDAIYLIVTYLTFEFVVEF